MTEKIISKQEVEKVAKLARIALTEEEKGRFARELNSILDYFKDISEVETAGTGGFNHYEPAENRFRGDEIREASDHEKEAARRLFPDREGDHLKVKEILNGGG